MSHLEGLVAHAPALGIPWEYFNLISGGFLPKGEKDPEKVADARKRYDAALAERVLALEERPELVVLAGWMHVFSAPFLEPLQKAGIRIINLHPALPGTSCVPEPPFFSGFGPWRCANECRR